MENIRIGRKDASDKEVVAAAKAAQCEEFINRLQKVIILSLGRMVLSFPVVNAKDYLLPEQFWKMLPWSCWMKLTASLDVESETMVQEAISQLIAGKTVLIIAHRMRTVAGADKS